jgi:hypothetical protein
MLVPRAVIALMALTAGPQHHAIRLVEPGADPARGVLVNHTNGTRPDRPPWPSRPTLVVVHGLNPFHPIAHFAIAERYGEINGARYSDAINVLGWDWNGCTGSGLLHRERQETPVAQGRLLADALLAQGLDPARIHLLGQSTGCIVAASAAYHLAGLTGQPVARLTLLDPLTADHLLIFQALAVASAASRVEHYWVPGLSGFGRPAAYPGILNYRLDGPRGPLGLANPTRTDHLHAVRWHLMHVPPW